MQTEPPTPDENFPPAARAFVFRILRTVLIIVIAIGVVMLEGALALKPEILRLSERSAFRIPAMGMLAGASLYLSLRWLLGWISSRVRRRAAFSGQHGAPQSRRMPGRR